MDPQTTPQPDDLTPAPTSWLARNGMNLLLGVAVFVFLLYWVGPEGLLPVALVVIGLGFMIFIHELGHFLAAKWCDVHIETFSIGFGPAIPGCQFQRGETTYKIAVFPLGGYVKMVGENPEAEEADDDPRSFKNKTVGQRMLIISAGVIMNVLCGFVCFMIVYSGQGLKRQTAVVGHVEAGSPAWDRGLQSGMVIYQIDGAKEPYFDDLLIAVALSGWSEPLPFKFGFPGQPPVTTEVIPRRTAKDSRPIIGVAPARALELPPPRDAKKRELPVAYNSAAAKAEPSFQFGDKIIGTTDPEHPDQVKPLRPDPRNAGGDRRDFFEFRDRMHLLAGKDAIIRVRRDNGSEADLKVPPEFTYRLGLRMKMGKVAAVRSGSPAQEAEIIQGNSADQSPGVKPNDIIDRVEVTKPDGGRRWWVSARPNAKQIPADLKSEDILDLDPVRLPFDLGQWAQAMSANAKPDWTVKLIVRRSNPITHRIDEPVELSMPWDISRAFEQAIPSDRTSPMDLSGLGIAYRVDTTVAAVYPDSPAEKAGMKAGDVIKEVRFYSSEKKPSDPPKPGKWIEVGPEEWANIFYILQQVEQPQVDLKVERAGATEEVTALKAMPDQNWPADDRGLIFIEDSRLQKGENFGEAVGLAFKDTYLSIPRIYMQIRNLLNRRLAADNLGGPIRIAETAYRVASENVYFYIWLLGMLNINLAVINFLPIPVLDGGHMVFLIYEKLRGRPPSEPVRIAATYLGVILILSLLVFATYNDISGLLKRF